MLRREGHGDASRQKSVMISAAPGQGMVEVDGDLSRVSSPTLLAQAGTPGAGCPRLCPAVLNISTDGDYNLPSWSVFSPLPVKKQSVFWCSEGIHVFMCACCRLGSCNISLDATAKSQALPFSPSTHSHSTLMAARSALPRRSRGCTTSNSCFSGRPDLVREGSYH